MYFFALGALKKARRLNNNQDLSDEQKVAFRALPDTVEELNTDRAALEALVRMAWGNKGRL